MERLCALHTLCGYRVCEACTYVESVYTLTLCVCVCGRPKYESLWNSIMSPGQLSALSHSC